MFRIPTLTYLVSTTIEKLFNSKAKLLLLLISIFCSKTSFSFTSQEELCLSYKPYYQFYKVIKALDEHYDRGKAEQIIAEMEGFEKELSQLFLIRKMKGIDSLDYYLQKFHIDSIKIGPIRYIIEENLDRNFSSSNFFETVNEYTIKAYCLTFFNQRHYSFDSYFPKFKSEANAYLISHPTIENSINYEILNVAYKDVNYLDRLIPLYKKAPGQFNLRKLKSILEKNTTKDSLNMLLGIVDEFEEFRNLDNSIYKGEAFLKTLLAKSKNIELAKAYLLGKTADVETYNFLVENKPLEFSPDFVKTLYPKLSRPELIKQVDSINLEKIDLDICTNNDLAAVIGIQIQNQLVEKHFSYFEMNDSYDYKDWGSYIQKLKTCGHCYTYFDLEISDLLENNFDSNNYDIASKIIEEQLRLYPQAYGYYNTLANLSRSFNENKPNPKYRLAYFKANINMLNTSFLYLFPEKDKVWWRQLPQAEKESLHAYANKILKSATDLKIFKEDFPL